MAHTCHIVKTLSSEDVVYRDIKMKSKSLLTRKPTIHERMQNCMGYETLCLFSSQLVSVTQTNFTAPKGDFRAANASLLNIGGYAVA
jgi:hypothetical protein